MDKIIKDIEVNKENISIWICPDWKSEAFQKYLLSIPLNEVEGTRVDEKNKRNKLLKIEENLELGIKKDILIKEFKLKRVYDKIRFKFLKSKAFRSLEIALKLESIEVKTPKAIAVIEKRDRNKNIVFSYYISEYVDCKYNLLEITRDPKHKYRRYVKDYLPQIGKDLRKMHKNGLVHNDFHPGNILIKNIDIDPEFYYIDLNRGRIKENLTEKDKISDIIKFNINNIEEEIFMKNYCPENFNYWLIKLRKYRKRRQTWKKIRKIFKISKKRNSV